MCARKSAIHPTDFDTYAVQNKEDVLERTMKVYRAMGMRRALRQHLVQVLQT
jgi:hypothetical protein